MAIHASHSGLPYPVRNARYTLPLFWLDADGDPTDAGAPDTEVSLDGAAFGDCAEEVVPIAGSGSGLLTLSALETNAAIVMVAAKSTSGNAKSTLAALNPRVLPILESGTAQAGAAGSITLAITAPAYSLVGTIIRTTGGTGGGGANNQARVVTAYNGTTKVATVVPNWEVNPASGTTYDILITDMASNAPVANMATMAAGSIAAASFAPSAINAAAIAPDAITAAKLHPDVTTELQGGLATATELTAVKNRLPTLLVGGKMDSHVSSMANGVITNLVVATGAIDDDALDPTAVAEITAGFVTTQDMVDAIWNELKAAHVVPNSFGDFLDTEVSSRASTAGGGGLDAAQTAAAVWGALRASYADPNTFGERVNADVTAISADAAAADALETMLDGTGGNVLSLRQLNIVNSGAGAALVAQASNGSGIQATGGGSADGMTLQAGATSGAGLRATGAGNTPGLKAVGNGTGAGFQATGGATGHGMLVEGAGIGSGLVAQGGVGAGADGARFVAGTGSNGDGLELVKNGTGLPMNPAASGGGGATAAEIADAVWAEDLTIGYATEGTAGKELKDASAGAGLTAAQVTAAVWDVTKGVRPANSFGESVNLNAAGLATNAIDADALNPDVATELNAAVLAALVPIQADTDNIQGRLPTSLAANGKMDSNVFSMAANTITNNTLDPTAGAEIADAVWAEDLLVGYATEGTAGKELKDAGVAGLTPLQVEDAVWNAARSAHVGATSFGGGVLLAANAVTPTAIQNDAITAAKLAADVGPEIAVSVWANAGRTLTGYTTLVSDIWAAATRTITGLTDPAVDNIWNRLRAAVTRPALSFGDYLDKKITDVATGSGGATASEIADAVWEEILSPDHTDGGSAGAALIGAGSAGDPWSANLAGYGANTAGNLVNANLNATVASRATQTSADAIKAETSLINAKTVNLPAAPAAVGSAMNLAANAITNNSLDPTAGGEIADAVWDEQLSGHVVTGSGGAALGGSFAAVDFEVAAIKAKTDLITGAPATVGAPMTLAAGAVNATSVADDAIDGDALAPSAITKIQTGLPAAGSAMSLTTAERDAIADAHFARSLPLVPVTDTAGEALQAARAQGFGRWDIVGDLLHLYKSDNATILRTFVLAPAGEAHTSRTPV